MRTFIFLCSFLLMASLASAQMVECKVIISNTTSSSLEIGIRRTTEPLSTCPTSVDDMTLIIPPGMTEVVIGTVHITAAPIRPFIVGAALWPSLASPTWQVNQCWNPSCLDADGPLNINFTYCSPYETHVTI